MDINESQEQIENKNLDTYPDGKNKQQSEIRVGQDLRTIKLNQKISEIKLSFFDRTKRDTNREQKS